MQRRLFGEEKAKWKGGKVVADRTRTGVGEEGIDSFSRMVNPNITRNLEAPTVVDMHDVTARSHADLESNLVNLSVEQHDSATEIIVHEMAHLLENDQEILEKAVKFLLHKAGPKREMESINKLTGKTGYNPYEVGFANTGFKNQYTAKVYNRRSPTSIRVWAKSDTIGRTDVYLEATEILSMGLERMHIDPIKFMDEEPEFFDFIWDTLIKKTPS